MLVLRDFTGKIHIYPHTQEIISIFDSICVFFRIYKVERYIVIRTLFLPMYGPVSVWGYYYFLGYQQINAIFFWGGAFTGILRNY